MNCACGQSVPPNSKFCPHCGRRVTQPAVKFLALVLFLVIVLAIVGMGTVMFMGPSTTPIVASQSNKVSQPDEDARAQRAVVGARLLKKSMRNPDSFKLTSALIINATGTVCYEYRAQNGFGGVNAGEAVLTPKGRFKTNEMDGFTSLWNRECAHKPGTEEAGGVNFFID